MTRAPGISAFIGLTATFACVLPYTPPPQPDPQLLGCYALTTNLPASYADSLGYHIPPAIRLANTEYNQWSVFPVDFEWHPVAAYARVFPPAEERVGEEWRRVSWATVAARYGRVAHAGMQWEAIARPADHGTASADITAPRAGWLEPDLREVILEVMRPHTSSPDRFGMCVWEGRAGIGDAFPEFPRVTHPGRRRMVFEGGPAAVIDGVFGGDLNDTFANDFWWPADRAWIVASEIDYAWSYVAGPAAAITALVAEPRLEALRVSPHDRSDYQSDTINGPVAPW